ncbi:MAG: hypothetical protein ACR2PZ_17655 [Pseudomonadales bacterium]
MPKLLVRWAQALPIVCLLCVALNQARLVYNDDLSPWSGGGFGMFSTTDAATDRHLHVYQTTAALRRELAVPYELADAVRSVLALPGDRQMRYLITALTEHGLIASGSSIEIQVWSKRYDRERLRPQSRVLRHYRSDDGAKR